MHAEAVLLVDHRQAQVLERDVLLEQRVRADRELGVAAGQPLQGGLPGLALVSAGQQQDLDARGLGQRLDGGVVLPGQDLGRCHEGGLAAGLDRRQHGEQGDHRLAAADIALQQPQHPRIVRHIGQNLARRPVLRARQVERQGGQRLLTQLPVASDPPAFGFALAAPDQGEG